MYRKKDKDDDDVEESSEEKNKERQLQFRYKRSNLHRKTQNWLFCRNRHFYFFTILNRIQLKCTKQM